MYPTIGQKFTSIKYKWQLYYCKKSRLSLLTSDWNFTFRDLRNPFCELINLKLVNTTSICCKIIVYKKIFRMCLSFSKTVTRKNKYQCFLKLYFYHYCYVDNLRGWVRGRKTWYWIHHHQQTHQIRGVILWGQETMCTCGIRLKNYNKR